MKNFYILLFSLATSFTFGQIPNGGFESWESVNNYEVPVFWETNQDTLYTRVTKDTIRIEGSYSLKLSSDVGTAWLDCTSKATISHKLDYPIGIEKSIFFNLRILSNNPDGSAFFSFFCLPYVNGMAQEAIIWQTDQEYPDFSLIEIPISNPEIDSLFIEITSGAVNGSDDGCYVQTDAWVDGFALENSTTSVENILQSQVSIFPNPTHRKITIKQDGNEYDDYCIFNSLGQEILHGTLLNNEIELTEAGIYFIQLTSNLSSSRNITRKIIVTQ